MKILHVTASYKPAYIYGGPIMSVSALCEALVKNDIEVEVFTTTANGSQELPIIPGTTQMVDGVKVTYFKRITKDHTHFSPALLKNLRARIKEFDVVHVHAWWNLVSVLAAYIAVRSDKLLVVSPRGMLSGYTFGNRNSLKKRLIHALIGKRLLQKAYLHATAQNEATAISNLVNPLSITVIPNFVKLTNKVLKREGDDNLSPCKLLFFSRIEEKKGLDVLLKSLPYLNFPFTLTIAGTGDEGYIKHLKSLVTDNKIAEKITWAGFVGESKFKLLSDHHLLVLPSHDENFGNVVIESLSVGTPVLVSSNVGLAHYVLDNKLGWVYDNDLPKALNVVADSFPAELKRIRDVAPKMIKRDFDEKNLIGRYVDLYQQISC